MLVLYQQALFCHNINSLGGKHAIKPVGKKNKLRSVPLFQAIEYVEVPLSLHVIPSVRRLSV